MYINAILDWCDQMVDKYQITDEDVAALHAVMHGIDEGDIYGEAEYAEDPADAAEDAE